MVRPDRRLLLVAFGGLVSVGCLIGIGRAVDVRLAMDALSRVDPGWIAVALGLHVLRVGTLVQRWWVLLRAVGDIRARIAVETVLVSYAVNAIVPARLGDAVRIVGARVQARRPVASVATSLVLERGLDALVLAGLAFGAVVGTDLGRSLLGAPIARAAESWPLVLAGAGGTVAIAGFAWAFRERWAPVREALRGVWVTVRRSARPRVVSAAFGLSITTWLLEMAIYYAACRSLALPVGLADALLVGAIGSVVVLVPSAPAGIGTFEAAAVAAFVALGVSGPEALAAAVLIHALVLAPITFAGLVLLPRWVGAFVANPAADAVGASRR